MNPQPFTHNLTSNDPIIESNSSEEKFNKGWLRSYYHAVIIFFVTNLACLTSNCVIGLHHIKSASNLTSIILFSISLFLLAAVALSLAIGLYLQYEAIRLKSIEKQDLCIKAIVTLLFAQTCATIFNNLCAVFMESNDTVSAIPLAIGIAFLLLALKVKSIMLGKAEKLFEQV